MVISAYHDIYHIIMIRMVPILLSIRQTLVQAMKTDPKVY